MKNLSLILNIVLLLAVAYLYVDRFSGDGGNAKAEKMAEGADEAEAGPLRIMYLNIDSLHAKSDLFQQKKAEIGQRQSGAEATMRKKLKAFESEVISFRKNLQSGNMTPKSAQEEEARLAKKEQDLMQQQERLAQDLMQETEAFNVSFNQEVRGYLDSLQKANNYDFVLVAGAGSQVLTTNENYDITQMVVDLLNKKEQ